MRPFQCLQFSLQVAALLCGSLAISWADQPVEPRVTLETNQNICTGGSPIPLVPWAGDPAQLNVWGGYCADPDPKLVKAKTSTFIAPAYLRLYSLGWSTGTSLALERVSDGCKFLIVPWMEDDHVWARGDYALPSDWIGKPVRLVAEGVASHETWRAFSEPLIGNGNPPVGDAGRLLGLTVLHFVAIFAFALALTGLAILRGGVRDTIQAGLITLVGTALPGYCIFWLSLESPRLAQVGAVCCMVAGVVGFAWCFARLNREGRAVLKALLTPVLLVGAAALMVLSTGFLYGGWNDPLYAPRCRYVHRLPPDNELPYLLAVGARLPHVPSPMSGYWKSSDRPPLQSAIVLSQFPLFGKPRTQGYTVVSVLAQSFWIFGMWLLLSALRLKRGVIALVLAACFFSGFVFLNTIFVWPKLLAAAYTLGFLSTFAEPQPNPGSRLPNWVAPGALLSWSLLAHGGAFFFLITAVPLLVFMQRPWPIKRMLAIVAFAMLLYSPWMLYQKFYDPPGNLLMKMHLAGAPEIDNRSFTQALADSYRHLTFHQWVTNKEANLEFAFGSAPDYFRRIARVAQDVVKSNWQSAGYQSYEIRLSTFFHPAVCLGFFVFAPLALAAAGLVKRLRTPEWRVARWFWIAVICSMLVWCLLMFSGGVTAIHAGAYANILLAMAACVLSFWALSPRLAVFVTALQFGVNVVVNEVLWRVPYSGGVFHEGIVHPDTLVLLGASFALILLLLRRVSREVVLT